MLRFGLHVIGVWTALPLLVITLTPEELAYIDKSTGGKHQFRRDR